MPPESAHGHDLAVRLHRGGPHLLGNRGLVQEDGARGAEGLVQIPVAVVTRDNELPSRSGNPGGGAKFAYKGGTLFPWNWGTSGCIARLSKAGYGGDQWRCARSGRVI